MRKHRRNITVVNNEIDYDKLAEAIVKAQHNIEPSTPKGRVLSLAFVDMISLCLRVLSICAFLVAIATGICLWFVIRNMLPDGGLLKIVLYITNFVVSFAVSFLLGFFASMFWKAATEIKKEKDRNYVVAVFSALSSFVALIVALVALIKG